MGLVFRSTSLTGLEEVELARRYVLAHVAKVSIDPFIRRDSPRQHVLKSSSFSLIKIPTFFTYHFHSVFDDPQSRTKSLQLHHDLVIWATVSESGRQSIVATDICTY